MVATLQAALWSILLFVLGEIQAFTELPKFSQMKLLYPGYHLHDGEYRNREVPALIGGNHTSPVRNLHNTSPLRMSVTLNRYGGRHAIGTEPVTLDNDQVVSIVGRDNQQYIFHNTAYGPYLAEKYGNPTVGKPNKHDPSLTMQPFTRKQGIVRFVSYHGDHAGGHIGLWDCDHFFKSPDWSTEHHLISVEFWETPDSYCAPKDNSMDLTQLLKRFRLVPRDRPLPDTPQENSGSQHHRKVTATKTLPIQPGGATDHQVRHSRKMKKLHRLKYMNMWKH